MHTPAQAAIALGGENSKKGVGRYEAVQGDQAREGELFGLANMLDHTLLVDLNKTIMERCARVDSEKGLDEDGYEVYEELKPVDGGDDKSYSNEEEIEDFDEDDEVDSLSDPKVQELPDGYEVDTAIVDLQTGKLSEAQKHDAELAELLLDENAVEYTGVPRAKRHKSGDGKTVKVLYNKETKTRQYQLPNTDYVIRRGGQPSQMTRDLLEKIAGTKRKVLMYPQSHTDPTPPVTRQQDIMTFMMEIKDMSDKEIEQMVDEHYGESFEAMLARKIKWDSEQGHAAHDPP
ncbi:hypothetical protein SARC_06870 [Sphaeroforma arctica JP610]|uniref:Uncharacterized protein n=1 Tax=Sphaeroforma arctica JP610 TaxID=667725 RepID=A0A0L0FW36_9EUKA|nr:hypothetical protein SARC_06870 [Sphaeroforma arctica JP610]KNC80776.1 hypothetical protein SARC_06870 [Sphaeroforma arctica JP610]|eukprot:XP_014154678.1 hypothetical protein SARC_06870 [Sphaeroforma arctica JP610]